jgi:hypothetical protein
VDAFFDVARQESFVPGPPMEEIPLHPPVR